MKTTRRRHRQFDSYATPDGVRSLLDKFRKVASVSLPTEENRLLSLLNAARYSDKSDAKENLRGRPAQWDIALVQTVKAELQQLLKRETGGRVSLQTFVGQHLRLLSIPDDVASALQTGALNKQEALALSRLTADKLQVSEPQAQSIRAELLQSHLSVHGSQNQLRARVQTILGESVVVSRETLALGLLKSDTLLEFKPDEGRHIFFETIKELFYAIRKFEPEDLNDQDVAEFMTAADSLANTIHAIELRIRQRRVQQPVQIEPVAEPVSSLTDPLTGRVLYKFSDTG